MNRMVYLYQMVYSDYFRILSLLDFPLPIDNDRLCFYLELVLSIVFWSHPDYNEMFVLLLFVKLQ